MKWLSRWLVLLGLMVVINGCSYFGSDEASQQTIRIENEEKWTIPVLSAMTGPIAFVGEPAAWSAEYAAEVINNLGGINGKPVEVMLFDTEFKVEKAMAITALLKDQALTVIGPMDAPGSEAVGGIIYEDKLPSIGAYAYEEVRDEFAPYAIAYMTDSGEGDWLAVKKWHELNTDIQTAVIFLTPTDASQRATADQLQTLLPLIGIELIDIIDVETGTLDCGPAAIQAINSGSQGYISLMRAAESSKLVSELRTRGVDEGRRITCSFSSFSSNYFDGVGETFLDGTYIWSKLDPYYEGEEWQALVVAYKEEFDNVGPTDTPVPEYYNTLMAIKLCYEELAITGNRDQLEAEKEAIARWFYNSPVIHGIQGDFQWVNGKKVSDIYYYQFSGSMPVRVE